MVQQMRKPFPNELPLALARGLAHLLIGALAQDSAKAGTFLGNQTSR